MTIYVYEDYIHNKGVLLRRLATDFGAPAVHLIDAKDITDDVLQRSPPDLLVVPGGADLYFCEKLDGYGNKAIRYYVENGGCYLGICAGAYYGSAYVDWASRDPDYTIQGYRELDFIKSTARGPVYSFIRNGDITSSWYSPVTLTTIYRDLPTTTTVSYAGGPVFELDDDHAYVLARYSDLEGAPPAIITKQCAYGRVVLSGPHIESIGDSGMRTVYAHNNDPEDYAHNTCVANKLAQYSGDHITLWNHVLGLFDIDHATNKNAQKHVT